jgi:hypothetical protein
MPLNLWWNNHFKPVFDRSSIISGLLVVMDIAKPVVRETKIENDVIKRDAATCGAGIAYLSMTLELTPSFNGFVLLDL